MYVLFALSAVYSRLAVMYDRRTSGYEELSASMRRMGPSLSRSIWDRHTRIRDVLDSLSANLGPMAESVQKSLEDAVGHLSYAYSLKYVTLDKYTAPLFTATP